MIQEQMEYNFSGVTILILRGSGFRVLVYEKMVF